MGCQSITLRSASFHRIIADHKLKINDSSRISLFYTSHQIKYLVIAFKEVNILRRWTNKQHVPPIKKHNIIPNGAKGRLTGSHEPQSDKVIAV
jgi:hypothetical protein